MKELVGRLSALDPEASETLKVIAYFDALVDGRVGTDGMLRGAAVLTGATIGHVAAGRTGKGRRIGSDGSESPPGDPGRWPVVSSADGSVVWLEREGSPHANDAMVLERLAIALSIQSARLDTAAPTRRAVEVLLSADATDEDRDEASARLSLGAHPVIHAVAVPTSLRLERPLAHAVVATRFGIARAVLAPDDDPPAARAGIGIAAASPTEVRESWRSALVALRLTDRDEPVVRAAELGALLPLAEAEDHRPAPHPDAVVIDALLRTTWTEGMLRALAAGASRRSLAAGAGVHHSTMGARIDELPGLLGYDPSTPRGRTRLDVALMLHRLARTRFDPER
ncbi:hypothetical protein JNB62_17315 [Microbacterium jejuense]|uniref:PucR C-terminal helix-turn-helix domain-containing protein n=1 Tax=Microbacterium jejuense TaxID=1263637 RepID=A0ABS7HSM8_9MICO|nr:helix-turn-helix domain-containing protein [Microbacterium jejuense]MBW9095444.1 hypothetical protein [Microbacterium jejuense]